MKVPAKIILDKQKILKQIEELNAIAKINDWVFDYDDSLDELVFGKSDMPRDSFLYNVNDEINLFLTPDSTVNGMHIEYFQANFLEHNQELKPVLKAFTSRKKTKSAIDTDAETALETELVADTFKSLFSKTSLVTAI